MADGTVTVYETEFVFRSGERLYVLMRPDRGDRDTVDNGVIRITLELSPTLRESYAVHDADLSYSRTTARLVSKADLEAAEAADRRTEA